VKEKNMGPRGEVIRHLRRAPAVTVDQSQQPLERRAYDEHEFRNNKSAILHGRLSEIRVCALHSSVALATHHIKDKYAVRNYQALQVILYMKEPDKEYF
jgi:hypothetical protein